MSRDVEIKIGATDMASKVLNKVSHRIDKFTDNIGSKAQRLGGSLTQIGAGFTAMGGAAVAGIGKSIATFAQFDDRMKQVKAITGATADEMTALRDKAKELGASTQFSASQAAEGMKFLGMAGFDTKEIIAGIGPVLSLAAAGALELGEASDIASDVGTAFGKTADQIGEVADIMAVASTSANTNVEMMGQTFKNVASVARVAGQELEETSAAIGILANSGTKAADAGTQMKIILQQMVKESKGLKANFGVTAFDEDGNFRDMLDIMQDVGAAMEDMTEEEKVKKLQAVFARGWRSAAILANATGEEVDKLRNKMSNAEGAAAEMAETMTSGLGGLGTKIMSALEGVQLALTETFEKPMKRIGQQIQNVLGHVIDWIRANPQLVKGLVLVSGAITLIGGTLMGIGLGISAAGIAISGLGTIASFVAGSVAAALTPVGLAVSAVLLPTLALGAAWLYLAAQTGLLQAGIRHLKDLFVDLFQIAKQTVAGIVNAIKAGEFGLAIDIGMAGMKVAWFTGLQALKDAWLEIWPLFWETAKRFFMGLAKLSFEVMTRVAGAIKSPVAGSLKLGKFLVTGAEADFEAPEDAGFLERGRLAAQANLDRLTQQAAEAARKRAKEQEVIDRGVDVEGTTLKANEEQKQMASSLQRLEGLMQRLVEQGELPQEAIEFVGINE